MASARAFFVDNDLDDDEEQSFSDNDLEENDDLINDEEDEELGEEDLNFSSTSRIAAAVTSKTASAIPAVPLAVPAASAVTIASVSMHESGSDLNRQRIGDSLAEGTLVNFADV